MTDLFLRDGVRLATVGDDLVSLDIVKGDYGCFPNWGSAVRIAGDGRVTALIEGAADALADGGLAGAARRSTPYVPAPALPVASVWRAATPVAGPAEHRRLAAVCAVGLPTYWTTSFSGLLAYAGRRRGDAPVAVAPETVRDAQVFDQLLPFVPFQGVCLFRSYMLLRYLRSAGRDARWVIGVRTYPFEAHCWLQVGETILDDAAERVCGFTPIHVA